MSEQTKDPIIGFKSVKASEDQESGKRRVSLSLSQEETIKLIETLTALVENERGTKIDVHVVRRQTNDGKRTFDSAFAFVKAIQEYNPHLSAGAKTFPAKPTKGFTDKDKLAKAKASLKTVG
jgi:hypothetical protein